MEKQPITSQAVRQVLRDYWQQYTKRPFQTSLAFTAPAIGTVLLYFVPPLVIAKLVNIVAEKGEIVLASVGMYVAIFAGAWFFGEVLWRFGFHFLIKIETSAINELGKKAFKQIIERDYDFYTNNFVGSLTKKASAYPRGFEIFTDTLSFHVVNNIFPILFATIILWRFSPWLPIILLVSIAIVIVIAIPLIRQRSKLAVLRHEASSKVVGRMSDAITNILAVKAFGREKEEQQTFGKSVDEYTNRFKIAANFQNLRFDTLISPMYVTTNTIGLIAAIFFTTKLGLQPGTMVVVFSYFSQVTRIFWEINRVYRNFESSISESAEFTQLVLSPPNVHDTKNAAELQTDGANIQFSNIDFKYGKENKNLFLSTFNLEIKSNQRVGLVGPSGGGKTTITKLLLRFIDLESGTITIDGQDIREVTQKSLRNAIAYVPQESLLFHRSLFENIAYGNDNATEDEVVQAAKLARADEFIENLPLGYKTLVGERGIKLSGGQRQRIAIARAIIKKAPILVLDEATSSLDSESEKYIQEGLWELMKDRTSLVIAHRLSTIKHLDRIIVLEQGKIVQDGKHEELIAQEGLYKKLWSHQSGEFLGE